VEVLDKLWIFDLKFDCGFAAGLVRVRVVSEGVVGAAIIVLSDFGSCCPWRFSVSCGSSTLDLPLSSCLPLVVVVCGCFQYAVALRLWI
jgi:hypothetical protein